MKSKSGRELVVMPKEDDYEDKRKLVSKRRQIDKKIDDEISFMQYQMDLQREHELERIVRKKIELEKVLEAKEKLIKEHQQKFSLVQAVLKHYFLENWKWI